MAIPAGAEKQPARAVAVTTSTQKMPKIPESFLPRLERNSLHLNPRSRRLCRLIDPLTSLVIYRVRGNADAFVTHFLDTRLVT